MKNKEKREIYFFSRLAKLINEDAEVLDALYYCRRILNISRIRRQQEARLCEGGREQILLL